MLGMKLKSLRTLKVKIVFNKMMQSQKNKMRRKVLRKQELARKGGLSRSSKIIENLNFKRR